MKRLSWQLIGSHGAELGSPVFQLSLLRDERVEVSRGRARPAPDCNKSPKKMKNRPTHGAELGSPELQRGGDGPGGVQGFTGQS